MKFKIHRFTQVSVPMIGAVLLGGASLLINLDNWLSLGATGIGLLIAYLLGIGLELSKFTLASVAILSKHRGERWAFGALAVVMVIISVGSMTLWLDRSFSFNAQELNKVNQGEELKARLDRIADKFTEIDHLSKATEVLLQSKSLNDEAPNIESVGLVIPFKRGSFLYWSILVLLSLTVDLGCIALITHSKCLNDAIKPPLGDHVQPLIEPGIRPKDANKIVDEWANTEIEELPIKDQIIINAVLNCEHGHEVLDSIRIIAKAHGVSWTSAKESIQHLIERNIIIKNDKNRFIFSS